MAKGPSFLISASAIQSGIDWKLYCLVRPVHLGVSALTERPRNAKAEAGGQRPADTKAGGLKLRGLKSRGLKSGSQRD